MRSRDAQCNAEESPKTPSIIHARKNETTNLVPLTILSVPDPLLVESLEIEKKVTNWDRIIKGFNLEVNQISFGWLNEVVSKAFRFQSQPSINQFKN